MHLKLGLYISLIHTYLDKSFNALNSVIKETF